MFLRHEGYLGAIGAFLKGAEEDSKEKPANTNECPQFGVSGVTVYIYKHYVDRYERFKMSATVDCNGRHTSCEAFLTLC